MRVGYSLYLQDTKFVREWYPTSDFLALDLYKHFMLSLTSNFEKRIISLIDNFVHSYHNEVKDRTIFWYSGSIESY